MSIFRCEKCGCVENTATSNYWSRKYPVAPDGEPMEPLPALCSECDPEIGLWHGVFQKMSAKGFFLGSDGFLYHKDELATDHFKAMQKQQCLKIVQEITE